VKEISGNAFESSSVSKSDNSRVTTLLPTHQLEICEHLLGGLSADMSPVQGVVYDEVIRAHFINHSQISLCPKFLEIVCHDLAVSLGYRPVIHILLSRARTRFENGRIVYYQYLSSMCMRLAIKGPEKPKDARQDLTLRKWMYVRPCLIYNSLREARIASALSLAEKEFHLNFGTGIELLFLCYSKSIK
jgi:hypothetical protein